MGQRKARLRQHMEDREGRERYTLRIQAHGGHLAYAARSGFPPLPLQLGRTMQPCPAQFSLFGDNSRRILSSAGFVAAMKAAMRGIVDASGKSREQVVEDMNDVVRTTGKGLCKGTKFISLATLEKWLAGEERGQLPGPVGAACSDIGDGQQARSFGDMAFFL
jgi:hypothetical protein